MTKKKRHKNVNLDDKKSQNSVKKTQKCKFKWQKSHKPVKKSHKNVNLGDKKSQTSVNKTQKCKFGWQKFTN